jgi:hypothetical protein
MRDTKNLQTPWGIMMDKKDLELYRFLDQIVFKPAFIANVHHSTME